MSLTIALYEHYKTIKKSIALLLNQHEGFKVVLSSDNLCDFKQSFISLHHPSDIILVEIHQLHNHGIELVYWLHDLYPDSKIIAIGEDAKYIQIFDFLTAGCSAYFGLDIDDMEFNRGIESVNQNNFKSNLENFIDSDSFFKLKKFNGCTLAKLSIKQRDIFEHLVGHLTNREIAIIFKIKVSTVNFHVDELGMLFSVVGRRELKIVSSKLGY